MNKDIGFEEVSIIETEDGEKWVNIDDLIISLHFQCENLHDEIKEEDTEFFNEDDLNLKISIIKECYSSLIDTLEDLIIQFNEKESDD